MLPSRGVPSVGWMLMDKTVSCVRAETSVRVPSARPIRHPLAEYAASLHAASRGASWRQVLLRRLQRVFAHCVLRPGGRLRACVCVAVLRERGSC